MKLAITIATYQRSDGKTPFYLSRSLDSIFSQTYQDFKVFIIGDKYGNEKELSKIVTKYPRDKVYFENLTYAKEREKYFNNTRLLWSSGGVNAFNYAINKCLEQNFDYICHLDYDDYWLPVHLESINDVIRKTNADWLCTKSTYFKVDSFLPRVTTNEEYVEFLPVPSGIINSSTCINFKTIPLRYRDVFEEDGKPYPSDADLWIRCSKVIKDKKLKSYFVNKLTCIHESEKSKIGA